ncbi:MAG: hypothetical protein K0T99_03305 [Alphaproteobacteria bacterium]|nr:hypothetical protein [Alphaproteobacteria bacterium]
MPQNKSKNRTGKYVLNKTIIILVFACFAAAAFYFVFQGPNNSDSSYLERSGYNDSISDKIDKFIWKKYKEYESDDVQPIVPKEASVGHCYEAEYVNQVSFINQLQSSFLDGHNLFTVLPKIVSYSNNDPEIRFFVSKLQNIFEYQEPYTLQDIEQRFNYLRKDISKEVYKNKAKRSLFMKSLMNVVTLEKRGDKAIAAGGVEAILEKSSRFIKTGRIKEAHEQMNELRGEYRDMASTWFMYVDRYLHAKEYITKLNDYVRSEQYRSKFYKPCK